TGSRLLPRGRLAGQGAGRGHRGTQVEIEHLPKLKGRTRTIASPAFPFLVQHQGHVPGFNKSGRAAVYAACSWVIEQEEIWESIAIERGYVCVGCNNPLTKDEYDMWGDCCTGCAPSVKPDYSGRD